MNPASARQVTAPVAPPVAELVGQPVQDVAASVSALNVSESQFAQALPLLFRPGPQAVTLQLDSAVEAVPTVVLPAGQSLHAVMLEEPTFSLYVPVGQLQTVRTTVQGQQH